MWQPEKMTEPPWAVASFWRNTKSFKMENSKEKSCSEFHGEKDGGIQSYIKTTNNENRSQYQNETLDYKLKLNAKNAIKWHGDHQEQISNSIASKSLRFVQVLYLLKITRMANFRAMVLPPQVTITLASSCYTFTTLQRRLLSQRKSLRMLEF